MSAAARPVVDVIVVTWNTGALTSSALRSLLDGDQGCDLKLFVYDNASSDGTPGFLRDRVPEAEIHAGAENLGFAAGVNVLLAGSTAPWVFLLNPDAWPEPGAIGRLIETALERPRSAAVVPRIQNPDGSLQHSTHPFPSLRVAAATIGRRALGRAHAARLQLEGAWLHDRPRPVDWAIGAAMLLPRRALDDVGPFDESFFMYVEDLEWCWRAHRRGWEIFFEPRAVVTHVGNVSGEIAFGERRTAAYMRNTYRFYRREHGAMGTSLYRALNVAGSGMRYLGARLTRDDPSAHYWRTVLKANLERASETDIRPLGGP